MAGPSRSRRSNFLIPFALTATAAAASFALYYFLSDDPNAPSSPRPLDSASDSEAAPARSVRSAHSERTLSERKPSIAIVVREGTSSSAVLNALPSPLRVDRANVFVLIYSPDVRAHPLSDSDGDKKGKGKREEGLVYAQARSMFPRDVPKEVVMPYTEEQSLVPMLKQLAPSVVYIDGTLVGEGQVHVNAVLEGGWVGGMVVLVEEETLGKRLAEGMRRWGRRAVVTDARLAGEEWRKRALQ